MPILLISFLFTYFPHIDGQGLEGTCDGWIRVQQTRWLSALDWSLPLLPYSPLRVTLRNSLLVLFFLRSSELGDCGVDESDPTLIHSLMHNPGQKEI